MRFQYFLLLIAAGLICGTVSANASSETTLYEFNLGSGDGYQPVAGLITDSGGNLYGTTMLGGANCGADGCGTVYELISGNGGKTWTEAVLYSFKGTTDGAFPEGSLVFDTKGNLYGTTSGGGTSRAGTIFELSPPAKRPGAWTETTLYNFPTANDGYFPVSLIIDSSGNLYGAEPGYPKGFGNVFELSPSGSSWSFKTLYSFQGGAKHDGTWPVGSVVLSPWGSIYGVTTAGGTGAGCRADGCGTVFQLTPQTNGTWKEKVTYAFTGESDGGVPVGIALDPTNRIWYGATAQGGTNNNSGTVFQVSAVKGGGWAEAVIYNFGGSDGLSLPQANVTVDGKGNVYGTTFVSIDGTGDGGIYKLAPPQGDGDWTEVTQYEFSGGSGGGSGPTSLVLNNAQSAVLGATEYGGLASSGGMVFKVVVTAK
ncbi:MAG TPA: choice-of-anchor tandem repeat GloVer-containing protein [Terriglobales bacterium]